VELNNATPFPKRSSAKNVCCTQKLVETAARCKTLNNVSKPLSIFLF